MPLYYFHFLDGTDRCEDDWGVECRSAEEAYLEASKAAHAMWPELLAARQDPRRCAFEITSESAALFRFEFAELLDSCDRGTRVGRGLTESLAETHRRACAAREGLRVGMDEVRKSLDDSAALLERIQALAPMPRK